MNVECNQAVIDELTTNFRYNDAVLRHLIIRTDQLVTEESPIMKAERDNRENRDRRRQQNTVDDTDTNETKKEELPVEEAVTDQQDTVSDTDSQEDV